ncbi:uncharacterized protein LOC18445141 [Amborella trichopoda]|uniref:PHD-type domain-containing protein n=1 Tax=Amborella trichopoda TaxID=13333 RepID=U5D308_AMBTC|nr:uncharacterized protein LOC18445141 [Amborella trichopoda]ERN16814.1 hypothetical protein AMTR_s00057p00103590 [Amborella trichopoda]|eukprot:XP_006855347.1 uncharacterized protein LOC18445141 [Amborella trichopoda]
MVLMGRNRGKIIDNRKARKRPKSSRNGDSDDSDEDFVPEEGEEEIDYDCDYTGYSCSSRDETERSLDFSSTSESEGNRKVSRAKPRRRFAGKSGSRNRGKRSGVRVSSEEDEEEFRPDSDEMEDEEDIAISKGFRSVKKVSAKKSIRKRKTKVPTRKRKKKSRSKKVRRRVMSISDDDWDDDDDDYIDDDDDEFVIEKRSLRGKKISKARRSTKSRPKRIAKPRALSDSDYKVSESDPDFTLSEKEIDDEIEPARKANDRVVLRSRPRNSSSLKGHFEESKKMELSRVRKNSSSSKRHDEECKMRDGSAVRKGKEKVESSASCLGKRICGICLSEERKGSIRGSLNCCDHYFCFGCIMEWSKVESRCPICKQRFVSINKFGGVDTGVRSMSIRIPKRDQVYEPSEEELRGYLDPYANIVCMECQQGGDDNLMLLCDICDSSAHTYCVGLGREVPDGNWYCDVCRCNDPGEVQDSMVNQATIDIGLNSKQSTGVNDRDGFTSPQPMGSSPVQSSPYPEVWSQVSRSTVSGRRRLRRQIHVLLSNNRMSQTDEIADNASLDALGNGKPSLGESSSRLMEDPEASIGLLSNSRRSDCHVVNNSSDEGKVAVFGSCAPLSSCAEPHVNGFRRVEGAKKLVFAMVKDHLNGLLRDGIIGRSHFKKIARRCTHTILAACGIKHKESIAISFPPPECSHIEENREYAELMRGVCSSCFNTFLKDVVLRLESIITEVED